MTASDIVTVIAGVGAPLTIVGAAVTFVVKRFDKIEDRLKLSEQKYARLDRDHGRLMVQVDRWRIAFRIVSAELRRHDADNEALQIAQEMLVEEPPVHAPDDVMDDLLSKLEQEGRKNAQPE